MQSLASATKGKLDLLSVCRRQRPGWEPRTWWQGPAGGAYSQLPVADIHSQVSRAAHSKSHVGLVCLAGRLCGVNAEGYLGAGGLRAGQQGVGTTGAVRLQ